MVTLTLIIVTFVAIGFVSAAENVTDTVISVDNETNIVQTVDEDVSNIGDESLSSNNDDVLTASSGTFTDLANDIENANVELNLTHNYLYTYHASTDTDINYKQGITINKPLIINGNGFTIDGDGVARAFNIKSNNVVLNNIKIINCEQSNSQARGGSIIWSGSNGTLQNCIFDKNIATNTNYGGEIYWTGSQGRLYNCTFISSRASIMGGAVYWGADDGILSDCNFIKCSSNKGVVYWNGNNGKLYNCNFDSCYASTSVEYSYGGAIYWCGAYGTVSNSNFTNCSASGKSARGGAIYWEANYGNLINCIFNKCYVSGSSASYSAFYWIGSYGKFNNCISKSCGSSGTIVSSAGALAYCKGNLCSFLNCSLDGKEIKIEGNKNTIENCDLCAVQKSGNYYDIINSNLNGFSDKGANCTINNCKIGLGYFYGENCTIDNCSFQNEVYIYNEGDWKNCTFFSSVYWFPDNGTLSGFDFYNCGVYWEGNNGTLSNCRFINCHSDKSTKEDDPACGGAVYWKGENGRLFNCSFENCYLSLKFDSIKDGMGGAVYWKGVNGSLFNCSFDKCSIGTARSGDLGGSVYWDGENGNIYNCNFTNTFTLGFNAYGGAVYWNANNGVLSQCIFQNCSVEAKSTSSVPTRDGYGSAIYWKGLNGRLSDCIYDGDLYNYFGNVVVKEDGIKLYTKLEINAYDVNPGETENITFDIGGTGTVTINIYKVKGNTLYKKYTLPINNSQIKITLDNLQFGTYNVTVISSGDDKFDSETKSVLFEALKYDSPITIINNRGNDLIAGDDLKIDISLNTDAKGYLFLTFEDNQYAEYMYSGHATFRLPKMTGGTHRYTVNFTGDDKYNPIFVSETIDVNYKTLDIDFNLNDEEEYGNLIILKPTVPSDYNNLLTVYVDDDRINSISPGKSLTLVPSDGFDVGEHTITIKYNGNDFYLNGECNSKINITQANMTFKVSTTTDLEIMQTILKVTLGKLPASGNLTLNIDNKSYTSSNFNYGYSNFILYNLTAGQHSYTISYSGDKNINPKIESSQITIPFKESKINVTVNNISVGDVLNIGMNVVGNPLTNISLYLNETFLRNVTSDEQVNLTNLNEGTYVLTAIYNRDHVYDYSNDTKTFTVSKIDPIMTVEVNNSTYGFPAKVIIGIDAEGNVMVKIGSLIFNDVKIENNSVILDVSDIDVGTYIVEVTYNGNYKYNTKSLNTTLTIKKASTNIFATVNNISFSQNTIINIKSSIDGIAIIKINETNMQNVSVASNIVVPVTFENITAGKHNVTITLKPTNNNYNESTYNTEFTVSKKETSLNLNVSDSIYGEEVIVNVTASENGRITIKMGDITREKNVLANTMVKINFGVLAANSYNVDATFNAGENYKPSNKHTTLIVSPAKAEITTIQVQNNTYGENTTINVKTNVNGVLSVKLNNGNTKTFNIDANKLTALDLGKYDVDNYNIDLTLDAGSNYTKATGSAKVTVNPKQTTVKINVDNSVYGNNVIVKVTASENGKVTVNVGNNIRTVDVEANKVTSVDFGILDVNSYEVSAIFDGGKNFNTSSDKTALAISPKASSVTLDTKDYNSDQKVIINVTASENGKVTMRLGSITKTIDINANVLTSVDFGILDIGSYAIDANFTAGNNYIDSSATGNVKVLSKLKDEDVNINIPEIKANQENDIVINLPADATGTVTLTIGNNSYTFTVTDGVADIKVPKLEDGNYDYKINYSGDSKYSSFENTGSIDVAKPTPEIVIPPLNEPSADGSVAITLPNDATGTVTLVVNGKPYSFPVVNGVANVYMPDLSAKTYSYSITYSGDSKYDSFTNTGSLTVTKKPVNITTSSVTTVYNGGKYLVVTLTDKDNNPMSGFDVTITINGKPSVITTDDNGQAKLSVNGIKPGVYVSTVVFSGSSKYLSATKSLKVTVKKATPKVTAKAKTFKKSVKTKKYTVTLKTNQNKVMKNTKVTIKVNKKTYTAKTNSKGVATFKLTKLTKKGKYTATVRYAGSKYYNAKSVKVKITVK